MNSARLATSSVFLSPRSHISFRHLSNIGTTISVSAFKLISFNYLSLIQSMGSDSPSPDKEFKQKRENTIRVYKHRGIKFSFSIFVTDWNLLCSTTAKFDYETIFSILNFTFFSNVSFVIIDEDGEPSPFSLPMTAVAGQYDPTNPLPEDDGGNEVYERDQESSGERTFDVYLHGNSAMLLR
jgi:hypothetical protein